MADNIIEVPYQNKKVNGKIIEIDSEKTIERWSEITLTDGTKLKIKPTVVQVVQLIDNFDQEGKPIFVVNSVAVIIVDK